MDKYILHYEIGQKLRWLKNFHVDHVSDVLYITDETKEQRDQPDSVPTVWVTVVGHPPESAYIMLDVLMDGHKYELTKPKK